MTSQIFDSKSSFGFDSVAMRNLSASEKFLTSNPTISEQERSSIYASMIFNLYVYLEGNMNNGLKVVHKNTPKNTALRKYIVEATKWNVHPFEVLKWLDIEHDAKMLDGVRAKYQEVLKFHGSIRNLVAHGGQVHSDGLHEWGDGFQTNIVEPDAELRKVIDFFKKNSIYQKSAEGDSYITTLATSQIFGFFKGSIKDFVSDLITGANSDLAKALFWAFDYEYFGLKYPGPTKNA